MNSEIKELTKWLNNYDEQLIFRLGANKFKSYQLENDVYEIKNNLGKIWIKEGMFLISFNSGWSLISTFPKDSDYISAIKDQVVHKKIAILLSILPSYRNIDFSSLFSDFWEKLSGTSSLSWENLTVLEITELIVPYLQKTKQEYLNGQINSLFPLARQLKEIEQQLFKIKSGPEIIKLIALLET